MIWPMLARAQTSAVCRTDSSKLLGEVAVGPEPGAVQFGSKEPGSTHLQAARIIELAHIRWRPIARHRRRQGPGDWAQPHPWLVLEAV